MSNVERYSCHIREGMFTHEQGAYVDYRAYERLEKERDEARNAVHEIIANNGPVHGKTMLNMVSLWHTQEKFKSERAERERDEAREFYAKDLTELRNANNGLAYNYNVLRKSIDEVLNISPSGKGLTAVAEKILRDALNETN